MTESEYIEMLRSLCSDHYERNLSLVEYRTRRKQILDMIDNDYNGAEELTEVEDDTQKQWRRNKPTAD